jgi:hypothetical protein
MVIFIEGYHISCKNTRDFPRKGCKDDKNSGYEEGEKGQNAKITLKGENPIDK